MSFFICTALLSMSRERLGLDRLPAMVELADGGSRRGDPCLLRLTAAPRNVA
jgi:hypothetical protein